MAVSYRDRNMFRIFITGSSDGLGRMAGELLISQGHSVVLHARSEQRAKETHSSVPKAEAVVSGDLTSITQTREVATQVNALGEFDAVIHNAGVGYREPRRVATEDGLSHVFAVNRARALHPDCADPKAKATGLPKFGSPSEWQSVAGRPYLGAPRMARSTGLLRYQASRRAFGFCDCQTLVYVSQTRSNQDGSPLKWVDEARQMICRLDAKHRREARSEQ